MDPQLLARLLGTAIERHTTRQEIESGYVFLPDVEIALQELLAPHLSGEDREALAYDDGTTLRRLLEGCYCRPKALLEFRMVSHPAGWISGLGGFQLDDRGYIFYDGEPDTRLNNPILGVWQPFDDHESFATCLIAAYERFLAEYLLISERMMIRAPGLLTLDLLYEALMAGLNRHPEYWDVVNAFLAASLPPADSPHRTDGNNRTPPLPASDLLRGYQPPPESGGRHERLRRFCEIAVTISSDTD